MAWPPPVWSMNWQKSRSAVTPLRSSATSRGSPIIGCCCPRCWRARHSRPGRGDEPADWWRERGVTLKYGCVATEIDVGRRELKIANEESIVFSRLVLATGSTALRWTFPAPTLRASTPFATAAMSICCWRWLPQEAGRRDRRRIARAGGGARSRQGRRSGDARSSDGPADGAPARCGGRGIAEISRRAQGGKGSPQRQHRASAWRDACRRRRTGERTATRGRRGDLRRRHPAQRRARPRRRHCRQSRHCRRRPAADRCAGYFCAGRMRRAPRYLLRPGRAGLRAGAGAGAAPRRRHRQLWRQRGRNQSESLRGQRIFRGRFSARPAAKLSC